jgi:hypothetical protein
MTRRQTEKNLRDLMTAHERFVPGIYNFHRAINAKFNAAGTEENELALWTYTYDSPEAGDQKENPVNGEWTTQCQANPKVAFKLYDIMASILLSELNR